MTGMPVTTAMSELSDWTLIGLIIVAAFLPNEIWRWAGVLVSSQIDEDSPLLEWVRAVSTALVAGLVARLLIFSPGALGDVPWSLRILAFAIGVAAYYATGRRMALGIGVGALSLLAVTAL